MDGILIIDKPAGITSHDVVARCRRILRTKRVGHTGTLDPFATGVVVVLVGRATRLAQFLDKDAKEYETVARFGFETDTGDLTGTKREEDVATEDKIREILSQTDWREVLASFRGEIEQTPPMYSAKKVAGKKLYELARKGIEIERKAVLVKIHELEILKDQKPKTEDQIAFRVSCSAGTYIRTLAEDIGRKIGVGAHLVELRRTRAGKFSIDRAVTLEKLEEIAAENRTGEILVSMNEAVAHLPPVLLTEEEKKRIKNGLGVRASFADGGVQKIRFVDASSNLVAIGDFIAAEGTARPRIVFDA